MTDPYRILGLSAVTDDESVRAAYLAAIRDCPPERDRLRFEQVRAAYESIATERGRLNHALFDTTALNREDVLNAVSVAFRPRRPEERLLRRVLGAK